MLNAFFWVSNHEVWMTMPLCRLVCHTMRPALNTFGAYEFSTAQMTLSVEEARHHSDLLAPSKEY